jgi:hypothetical protein
MLEDIARIIVRQVVEPLAEKLAEFARVTNTAKLAGTALKRAFIAFLTRNRGGKLPRPASARGRAAVLKRAMVLRARKRPN